MTPRQIVRLAVAMLVTLLIMVTTVLALNVWEQHIIINNMRDALVNECVSESLSGWDVAPVDCTVYAR